MFVTHDVAEAMKLGTKVLVIDAGVVQQYGTPTEVLAHPATPFVRELLARATIPYHGAKASAPLAQAAVTGGSSPAESVA